MVIELDIVLAKTEHRPITVSCLIDEKNRRSVLADFFVVFDIYNQDDIILGQSLITIPTAQQDPTLFDIVIPFRSDSNLDSGQIANTFISYFRRSQRNIGVNWFPIVEVEMGHIVAREPF